MRIENSELFDYEIEIDSNEDFGKFWAIVEDFYIPESFVSEKGAFMFRIGEDDKDLKDTWLLVIPSDIRHLYDFLLRKKTYGDFLKLAKKLYLVVWDLQNFNVSIDREVSLKEIENKVVHIWNCKVFPEDIEKIREIVDLLKQSLNKGIISYSTQEIISLFKQHLNNLISHSRNSTILKTYVNIKNANSVFQTYVWNYQGDSLLDFDSKLYLSFTKMILNVVGNKVDRINDLYDIAA